MSATLSADGRTLMVRVPMTIRKRGGRKLVVAPEGTAWAPERRVVDDALVKALARAHRWRRMLETGVNATIGEIAAAERINPSYASRVRRLTLLARETVEAILDGRQGAEVTLDRLLRPFPVARESQSSSLPAQHGIRSSERGSRMALTPSDNSAAIGPQ